MSAEQVLRWLPRALIVIGVAFLVAAAVSVAETRRFLADAERASGTIVRLIRETDTDGDTYYPVVRFETRRGRRVLVESSVGMYPPPRRGASIELVYDPDDPRNARLAGFFELWLAATGYGVLGLGFTVIGVLVVRHTRGPSAADVAWLRAHGVRVDGTSPRVVHCDELDVFGSSPFRVDVDVHDPQRGGVRVLRSDHIWFDPTPHLRDRDALDVYLDPARPTRYLVDLSFLPASADEGDAPEP